MFGPDSMYFHGIIRKYVIYFGSLFSNIWIQRDSVTKQPLQTFRIPINYGTYEKFLARLDGNSDLDRPIAIQLPRMTFEITSMTYDSDRKLLTYNPIPIQTGPGSIGYTNNPIPYNIGFRLSIMTKSVEDGTRIVEQILPVFTPDFHATLNIIPELDAKLDVPIILNDVSNEDTYEGNFETRRAIIWTLDFTMKAWIFGPVEDASNNIIKDINLNIAAPSIGVSLSEANPETSDIGEKIEVYPGKTVANTPVAWEGWKNSPNHPTNYVDPMEVDKTDNWEFIVDFSEGNE